MTKRLTTITWAKSKNKIGRAKSTKVHNCKDINDIAKNKFSDKSETKAKEVVPSAHFSFLKI